MAERGVPKVDGSARKAACTFLAFVLLAGFLITWRILR
jgi:hypothetical protein